MLEYDPWNNKKEDTEDKSRPQSVAERQRELKKVTESMLSPPQNDFQYDENEAIISPNKSRKQSEQEASAVSDTEEYQEAMIQQKQEELKNQIDLSVIDEEANHVDRRT